MWDCWYLWIILRLLIFCEENWVAWRMAASSSSAAAAAFFGVREEDQIQMLKQQQLQLQHHSSSAAPPPPPPPSSSAPPQKKRRNQPGTPSKYQTILSKKNFFLYPWVCVLLWVYFYFLSHEETLTLKEEFIWIFSKSPFQSNFWVF